MNLTGKVCLIAIAIGCSAFAQDRSKPQLRPGISVQMAAASHATATPDADSEDAVVVTITSAGKMYVGIKAATVADIAQIRAKTVYVKADARANYQSVVNALDALQGHSTFLLTLSPKASPGAITPPYTLSLAGVGH